MLRRRHRINESRNKRMLPNQILIRIGNSFRENNKEKRERKFKLMKTVFKIKMLAVVVLLSVCFYTQAQKFYAQVNSKQVQVGQMFECAFIISHTSLNQGGEFSAPNFKDFDVASGP